jgi:hypothetical protein
MDGMALSKDWAASLAIWSMMSAKFAEGAVGDIHVFVTEGFAANKVFWNDELPEMRKRQAAGLINKIYIHITTKKVSEHPDIHGAANWEEAFEIDELVKGKPRLKVLLDGKVKCPDGSPSVECKGTTEDGKELKWYHPNKATHEYDIKRLQRFMEKLRTPRPHATSLGYLYEYKVLPKLCEREGCLAAYERMLGGVKITVFDYNKFLDRCVFMVGTNPRESDPLAEALDSFLAAKNFTFDSMPQQIYVVHGAVIYANPGEPTRIQGFLEPKQGIVCTDLAVRYQQTCPHGDPRKLHELTGASLSMAGQGSWQKGGMNGPHQELDIPFELRKHIDELRQLLGIDKPHPTTQSHTGWH